MKRPIDGGGGRGLVDRTLDALHLATVCEEASCPNRAECYASRTATFLLLGKVCTRGCRFCDVGRGIPDPPDPTEPRRVAEALLRLGLAYVVFTSVTRDDLPDGGAAHFAAVISELRRLSPEVKVEVLVPDFGGNPAAVARVIDSKPDVFNHNIETVPRLYPVIRPEADYDRSLRVLEAAAAAGLPTKTGLMLGLGETEEEVAAVLRDCRGVGVQLLTLGQYLAPSAAHFPVAEFITPARFDEYRHGALALGFTAVASGPFVRSSYQAETLGPTSRSSD